MMSSSIPVLDEYSFTVLLSVKLYLSSIPILMNPAILDCPKNKITSYISSVCCVCIVAEFGNCACFFKIVLSSLFIIIMKKIIMIPIMIEIIFNIFFVFIRYPLYFYFNIFIFIISNIFLFYNGNNSSFLKNLFVFKKLLTNMFFYILLLENDILLSIFSYFHLFNHSKYFIKYSQQPCLSVIPL